MNAIDILISCMIVNIVGINILSKLIGKNLKIISKKYISAYVLMTILIWCNYLFLPDFLRAVTSFIIMTIISMYLFSIKLKEAFFSALLLEVITILSEIIFSIVISIISNLSTIDVANIFHGTIVVNILVTAIMFVFSKLLNINKIYSKIIQFATYISNRKILFLLCFIIWCLNLIFYFTFYNKNNYLNLIFNLILGIIYFSIILNFMIKDNKYNRIYFKYMKTLESLEEYESIINEYRVINHENKNQLLCIKGMTRNKKLNDYLDEVIGGKSNRSDHLIQQALLIPIGGLRGLIYSKLIIMKNKNINYTLHIDKKINRKIFNNISSKDLTDICQIIGVYLDNAIEETETIKNATVVINIYLESSHVYFEILNNIKHDIDLNKLGVKRYTTKNGNHGYGLMLVKKILKENSHLSSQTKVSNKIIKQQLILEIKK